MSTWHDHVLAMDVVPPAFNKGRTFMGCQSPQATLTADLKAVKLRAQTMKVVSETRRLLNRAGRIANEQKVAEYATERGVLCACASAVV